MSASLTAQDQSSEQSKSPTTASVIALTGSVIPIIAAYNTEPPLSIVLLSSGLIFGPVLGYTYMEQHRIGLKYAIQRALILGVTAGSIYLICALGDCNADFFGDDSGREFGLAVTFGLIGTSAIIIHNVMDSFKIGRRIESRNQQIAILPVYFHETRSLGLKAFLKF